MQWALLGVIVIALIAMSGRYPKVAFPILGLLVIGAMVLVYSTGDKASNSRSRIDPESVQIENAVIVPAYGGSYQLSARLVNADDDALLKEAVLSITMLDCASDQEDSCQVIGQSEQRLNIRVPAGQARDISQNIYFDNSEPRGEVRWRFAINQTRS